MKKAIPLIAIVAILVGCTTSARRISYNSLASVGQTVDASMKAYCDLVVANKVSASTLPKVAKEYDVFQAAFGIAIQAAQFSSNAPAGPELISAAARVTAAIDNSRRSK